MASTEARLTRAAIALSIFLVLVLSGLAIYSVISERNDRVGLLDVLRTDDTEGDSDRDTDGEDRGDADDATGAASGLELDIDDRDLPVSVGCGTSDDTDADLAVSIINRAEVTTDYRVTLALTAGGDRTTATADIRRLGPGERRDVAVRPDRRMVGAVDCAVDAIETGGRILFANS